ncbi:armadillo-type protein [Mortierella sp. GBAus27b]|nr:armadillo-type protein [Mortierella sp. GBAus27b]
MKSRARKSIKYTISGSDLTSVIDELITREQEKKLMQDSASFSASSDSGGSRSRDTLNPRSQIVPWFLEVPLGSVTDHEQVVHMIRDLLKGLTHDNFNRYSDRLVEIVNVNGKAERDGATLKLCAQLIFESMVGDPELYAELSHKLQEGISDEVKDTSNAELVGRQLFRKYLFHKCLEVFEGSWWKYKKDKVDGASLSDDGDGDDDDDGPLAKRQGLGLVRFLEGLFKMEMVTEKIMHGCVTKLLAGIKDPDEDEVECLCLVMKSIGLELDHGEYKSRMDIYFSGMARLFRNTNLSSHIRIMVLDVIILRANKWGQEFTVSSTVRAKIINAMTPGDGFQDSYTHEYLFRVRPSRRSVPVPDTESTEEFPSLSSSSSSTTGRPSVSSIPRQESTGNVDPSRTVGTPTGSREHGLESLARRFGEQTSLSSESEVSMLKVS